MNNPSTLWAPALSVASEPHSGALWTRRKKKTPQKTPLIKSQPSPWSLHSLPTTPWLWEICDKCCLHLYRSIPHLNRSSFIPPPPTSCGTIITGDLISRGTKAIWPSPQVQDASRRHPADMSYFHQLVFSLKNLGFPILLSNQIPLGKRTSELFATLTWGKIQCGFCFLGGGFAGRRRFARRGGRGGGGGGGILAISLVLTKTVITQKAIQLTEAVHLHGLTHTLIKNRS